MSKTSSVRLERTAAALGNRDALLPVPAAAEYLSVSTKTLAHWRWRGCGPVFVKIGGAVRYRRSDLDRFISANSVEPMKAA